MKIKILLFIILNLLIYKVYSQKNIEKNQLREYFLIDRKSDTLKVYGGNYLDFAHIQSGFKTYNSDGIKQKLKIIPEKYKYLLYKNEKGELMKLKSLPVLKHDWLYPYRNAFMISIIDPSNEDLKKGKVGLFFHEFLNKNIDINVYSFTNLYLLKRNGIFLITKRRHFKKFPKLLGKKLYDEIKHSKKNMVEELYKYFNKYNLRIDSLNIK